MVVRVLRKKSKNRDLLFHCPRRNSRLMDVKAALLDSDAGEKVCRVGWCAEGGFFFFGFWPPLQMMLGGGALDDGSRTLFFSYS